MNNFYRCGLFVLMTLLFWNASAQGQKITGSIKDASTGESLPGVTIVVKGTSKGTVSDISGNYSLDGVGQDGILVFSFIGYESMESPIGGRSVIDVDLELSLTELTEVVVIGYGTQKKRVATGAIASVKSEEITATPITRIEQALQGRTPGVQVTNQSGQPGEEPTVRIRGAGTTGNAKPLYVVDGLVVTGIDFLNPADIESMDVLKDAASAAIYGARAANGVILITTKSGKSGSMNVSYSGYYGVQNVTKKIDMLNAEEYRMMQNEGARNGGFTEPFDLNEVPAHDTDWQEELFEKNAPIFNHNISVTGGNEHSTYASSISYFSQQGIIGGSKSQFDRFSARINSSHTVKKIFKFGNNLAYSHIIRRGIDSNTSFNGAYSSALNLDPLTPLYETDPDVLSAPPYSTQPVVTTPSGQVYGISNILAAEVVNPLALLENSFSEDRVDKLVGNIFGEVEVIEGLKIRTSLGTDLAFEMNDSHIPVYYLNGSQSRTVSTVNKEITRFFTWQWENTVSYSKKIGDHNLSALVGTTALEHRNENLFGSNANVSTLDPDNVYLDLALDTLDNATGGAEHNSLYSIFGRVTYDFKDKYSFTAILRRDGSSRFGANNRFGIFPSLGAAWVISDESFFPKVNAINFMKLRASWGVNGNEDIGNYQYVSRLETNRTYLIGASELVGTSPTSVANADVKWEESEQLDLAVELGLFENRMTFVADYYVKTTKDLLETVSIPLHVGNEPAVSNVGSIQNKGIELALNWRGRVGDLNFSVGVNGAYNINTVTNIENDEGFLQGATWAIAGPVSRAEEGQPVGYFWGLKTDGIFQTTDEIFSYIGPEGRPIQENAVPGDVRFVDVDGDGDIDDDDKTFIGSPTPDWTMGSTITADYKNFDFSLFLVGSFGNDVFNGAQRRDLRFTNMPSTVLDRWTGEGTSNSMPRFTWTDTNNNNAVSDLYIEDASFVRIKNVQLGYTMPESFIERIGGTSWRFYVSVENLLTMTKYSGADPEIGMNNDDDDNDNDSLDIGIDRGIYPQARTFRLGTTLTF